MSTIFRKKIYFSESNMNEGKKMLQLIITILSFMMIYVVYLQTKGHEMIGKKAQGYYEIENDIKKLQEGIKKAEWKVKSLYQDFKQIECKLKAQTEINEKATEGISKGIKISLKDWEILNQELSKLTCKLMGVAKQEPAKNEGAVLLEGEKKESAILEKVEKLDRGAICAKEEDCQGDAA